MAIRFGSASIDENGKVSGGIVGDQTGKEIRIQNFYSYPWDCYLECPNKKMAETAAQYMEQICLDDNFGYDQNERTSGYVSIINNGWKVKGAKGEFDCSSLVSSCYRLAGLDISVSNTTYTLKKILMEKGFALYTDAEHLKTDKYAKRGGIFLSEQHHVVMALDNGEYYKKKDYKTIIRENTDQPDKWISSINIIVDAAKAKGDLGVYELLQFIPTLIEKIGNH